MKKIIALSAFLFQSFLIIAQMPGQMSSSGMMPKYNAKNAAGILKYQEDKVFKKLKITDAGLKKKVTAVLSAYNSTIDEIVFLNTDTFKQVEKQIKEKRALAMATQDREIMMSAQLEAKEKLAPVKKKVNIATAQLNSKLEKILSKKQYTKWLKYQKSKRNALKPKNSMGNGQGRGMGKGKGMHGGQGRGSGQGGGGRGGMMGF